MMNLYFLIICCCTLRVGGVQVSVGDRQKGHLSLYFYLVKPEKRTVLVILSLCRCDDHTRAHILSLS